MIVGFAWTIRLIALICGLLGIASFFLLKTRLPPKPAGSFFYLQAFKNAQYTLTVLNFVVSLPPSIDPVQLVYDAGRRTGRVDQMADSIQFIGYGFFAYLTFIGTYGQLAGLGHMAPYLL